MSDSRLLVRTVLKQACTSDLQTVSIGLCLFPVGQQWIPWKEWYLVEIPHTGQKESRGLRGEVNTCQHEEAQTGLKALHKRASVLGEQAPPAPVTANVTQPRVPTPKYQINRTFPLLISALPRQSPRWLILRINLTGACPAQIFGSV